MSAFARSAFLGAALLALTVSPVHAERKTVCTITVNSPDERDVFRRALPQGDYDFVELVERGREDWLASACRRETRCDVLLISGHFDGGTEFYSDRLDAREYLPVDVLERAACSDSCPGLFSQLKEVYLFGCNTLNTEATRSASGEVVRSLVRSGRTPVDAQQVAAMLGDLYGETNRDRMRHIFKDVPVIYGFPGKAPLGKVAGPILERYFQSGGDAEIASRAPSPRLLESFAASAMTATVGLTDADPRAGFRRDMCQLADERLTPAQKLGFIHEVFHRDMGEVRLLFDRIEQYAAALTPSEWLTPPVAAARDRLARDTATRARYLTFERDADSPSVRARMVDLAARLGWLTPSEQRDEVMRIVADQLAARGAGSSDVDLVCALNRGGDLDPELHRLKLSKTDAGRVSSAAMLACLGSDEGRSRTLRALTSPNADEVEIAQVYLRHRPIVDGAELRNAAMGISRMTSPAAQVKALDALAQFRSFDRDSLIELARSFTAAKTLQVQRAIAGILIRADYRSIEVPDLARILRERRFKSPDGEDVIDVLIRRLQTL